jgi:hypothetical protein
MDVSDSTSDDEWVSLLFRGERHPSNSFKWINIQLLKKSDVWDIASREGLHTREDLQLAIEQIEQILENENGALFEAATVTGKEVSTTMDYAAYRPWEYYGKNMPRCFILP